jgi:hypothetical protein
MSSAAVLRGVDEPQNQPCLAESVGPQGFRSCCAIFKSAAALDLEGDLPVAGPFDDHGHGRQEQLRTRPSTPSATPHARPKGSTAQAIRDALEAVRVAEHVGLDFFGFGEHHTSSMPVSSPTSLVIAAAASTGRIKLGATVSVLSTDKPIRVFQQLATARRDRPGPHRGGGWPRIVSDHLLDLRVVVLRAVAATASALSALVAELSAGLRRNMQTSEGLGGLIAALSRGSHRRYIENPGVLENADAVAEGNGILGHVLGSKEASREVASRASHRAMVERTLPGEDFLLAEPGEMCAPICARSLGG